MGLLRPSNIFQVVNRFPLSSLIAAIPGLVASWDFQDPSGSLARVQNPAVALGRDIVINGNFSTDTSWVKGTGVTISGGTANSDGTNVGTATFVNQTIPIVSGKSYEVTFTIISLTSGSCFAQLGGVNGTNRTAPGTYTQTIVAGASGGIVIFQTVANTIASIDNVSVKEINIPASASIPNTELVINGGFVSDTVWIKGVGWSIASGRAIGSAVTTGILSQNIASVIAGRRFRDKYTLINRSAGSIQTRVGNTLGLTRAVDGSYDELIIAGSTTDIRFVTVATPFTGDIDNVSLVQVPEMSGYAGNGVSANQPLQLQPATPLLGYAYTFDGSDDFVNIYSPQLNGAFNPNEGTLFLFLKPVSMTDGQIRTAAVITAVNISDQIIIRKVATNNTIECLYAGGGISKARTFTKSSLLWAMVAITWSIVNDRVRVYLNGVQQGANLTSVTPMSGNLTTSRNAIGTSNIPAALSWNGGICYPTIVNREMSASELLNIARTAGVAA